MESSEGSFGLFVCSRQSHRKSHQRTPIRILKKFKLQDRVLAVITDEGKNFKAALETSGKLLEKLASARTESGNGTQRKYLKVKGCSISKKSAHIRIQVRSYGYVVSLTHCTAFAQKDCEKNLKQCRK